MEWCVLPGEKWKRVLQNLCIPIAFESSAILLYKEVAISHMVPKIQTTNDSWVCAASIKKPRSFILMCLVFRLQWTKTHADTSYDSLAALKQIAPRIDTYWPEDQVQKCSSTSPWDLGSVLCSFFNRGNSACYGFGDELIICRSQDFYIQAYIKPSSFSLPNPLPRIHKCNIQQQGLQNKTMSGTTFGSFLRLL